MNLPDSLIITLIILVGGIVLVLTFWHLRKRNHAWRDVARTLDLRLVAGTLTRRPELSGTLDGIKIQAQVIVEGARRDNRRVYTRVIAQIHGQLPPGLTLYREGFFQKVGKTFGVDDVQVDDEELDSNFIIKGSDRAAIRQLLRTPRVKRALLIAQQRYKSLRVENHTVLLKENAACTDPDKLTGYIRISVDLARALGEAVSERPDPASALGKAAPNQPARQPAGSTSGSTSGSASGSASSTDPGDWW